MDNQACHFLQRALNFDDHKTRPWVTLTYAQSIDGFIGHHEKTPLQLSSQESLILTHRMRTMHDGILVGIQTVLSDNPRLTARLVPLQPPPGCMQSGWVYEQPRPVILDSRFRIPLNCRLIADPENTDNDENSARSKKPWIVVRRGVLNNDRQLGAKRDEMERAGCRVIEVDGKDDGLDLDQVLFALKSLQIRRLMVEGGATVIRSFLRQPDMVDAVIVTIAPLYLGAGVHISRDPDDANQRRTMNHVQTALFGSDIVISGTFNIDKE